MKNYKKVLMHNKKYKEGKVSWKRKMTEDSDLTFEEWKIKGRLQIEKKHLNRNLLIIWWPTEMVIR